MEAPLHKACGTRHWKPMDCPLIGKASRRETAERELRRVDTPVHKAVHGPVHAVHGAKSVDNRVDTLIRELGAHGVNLDALEALARGELELIPTSAALLPLVKAEVTTDRKAYKRDHERKRRAEKKATSANANAG